MREIAIRKIAPGEEDAVCARGRQVCEQSNRQDSGSEGVAEFCRFADPRAMTERVAQGGLVLGAFAEQQLVGMLEFVAPDRIALMFVTQRHHGIGSALLKELLSHVRNATPSVTKLTVHASRQAAPVYEKMGFRQIGDIRTEHGITYLPMTRDL